MNFKEDGCEVVKNAVSIDAVWLMQLQFDLHVQASFQNLSQNDIDDVFLHMNKKRAWGQYGLAISEGLLVLLQPIIEKVTNKKLLPCYSFIRKYFDHAELLRHVDRPSCEYSASFTIQTGEVPWPLWIKTLRGQDVGVNLNPGDLLVYRGNVLPHWREICPVEQHTQVFLHYVDADGPFTEFKFDTRECLATPYEEKREKELRKSAKDFYK